MNASCQCGAVLELSEMQFPQKARCHTCGRVNCVLDDGTTIDADDVCAGDISAIQTDVKLNVKSVPATSITATAPPPRERHSVANYLFVPSCMLAFAVPFLFIAIAGYGLFVLEEFDTLQGLQCYALGSLIVSAVLFLILFAMAVDYHKAQREWLAKYESKSALLLARPWWHKVLLWISIIAFLMAAFDIIRPKIAWIAHRDVEITLRVLDAVNNKPIARAHIEVTEVRGDNDKQFHLVANGVGEATRLAENCGYSGTTRPAPFFRTRETSTLHPPGWRLRILADGYQETEVGFLSDFVDWDTVQKTKGKIASMRVTIHLKPIPRDK